MTKQIWTVFGVYDEDQSPLIEFIEAKDKKDARSKVLRKVEGVILIAGIAPGKITGAGIDDLDDIVPIRGKQHEIEVTRIRVSRMQCFIPARCSKCKSDMRRAGALHETLFLPRDWAGHLSHDSKHYVHERDYVTSVNTATVFDNVMLICGNCGYAVWNGLQGDT